MLDDTYAALEEGYYSLMDGIQERVPVYDYFINPIEEKGIPSFPIFILLILLIIAGGIFLLWQANQNAELKVLVLADGKPLQGAQVSLVWRGATKSTVTDSGGVAFFDFLKAGERVALKIQHEGYEENILTTIVEKGKTLTAEMKKLEAAFELQLKITDMENSPIPGALIEYSFGEISDSVYSDGQGNAKISADKTKDVQLAVSKGGYEDKIATVPAGTSAYTVTLEELEISRLAPETATLRIYVVDENGAPKTANVKICFASSSCTVPLKNLLASGGFLEVNDFDTGTELKIIASAEGYVQQSKTVALETQTLVSFELVPVAAALNGTIGKTVISVFDAATNASVAALIAIFTNENDLVNITESPIDKAEFWLLPGIYYAVADADGYLFEKTLPFYSGESKSIYLIKQDANNSKTITLFTMDESRSPVSAYIAFLDLQGAPVPPYNIQTAANGLATVPDMPVDTYQLLAETPNGLRGGSRIDLRSASSFNITLSFAKSILRLNVLENLTSVPISNYNATVFDLQDLVLTEKSCTNSVCDLELPSYRNYSLEIEALNYLPAFLSIPANELMPSNITTKIIYLQKNASVPSDNLTLLPDNPTNIFSCPKLKAIFRSNRIDANCNMLVMKVDSIFPADAIPLDLKNAQGQAITSYNFQFSDPLNRFTPAQVASCFDFSAFPGGPALRYNPTKLGCPAYYQPTGNSINSANFSVTITNLPPTISKTFTLIVWSETDLPFSPTFNAIDASFVPYKQLKYPVSPQSYYLKDDESYSELKVASILNNRQLMVQADNLKAAKIKPPRNYVTNTLLSSSQNRGSATLFGWETGAYPSLGIFPDPVPQFDPPTVSVSSATAYEPGSISSKVESFAKLATRCVFTETECGADEYAQAKLFVWEGMANYTAYKTVFRRAAPQPNSPANLADLEQGSPYKYFASSLSTQPVTFSMVMAESAHAIFNKYPLFPQALSANTANIPAQCKARVGVFKFSISSYDGGVSWHLPSGEKFKVEPLYITTTTNNYNCPSVLACNLLDAYYGNPLSHAGFPNMKHCFSYDWPIIPDGGQSSIPYDMRGFQFLGTSPQNLPSGSFYLSGYQNASLDTVSGAYRLQNGGTGTLNPYRIDTYPNVFAPPIT